MARSNRRPRTRCRLRCHLKCGSETVEARVTSLSEQGLGLVVPLDLQQGEEVALRIQPPCGGKPVTLRAVVWNVAPCGAAHRAQRVGCVVSTPTTSYLQLVSELATPTPLPGESGVRLATPAPQRIDEPYGDLPRSREPLPPPKPAPEEHFPTFRVRLKQVGGPRTRSLPVRARSAGEAGAMARRELGSGWELIEAVLLAAKR